MLPLALILLLTPAQAWGSPSAEEFAVEDVHHEEWAPPPQQPRATPRLLRVVNGAASWHGPGFYGRQTANGERLRKGNLHLSAPDPALRHLSARYQPRQQPQRGGADQ